MAFCQLDRTMEYHSYSEWYVNISDCGIQGSKISQELAEYEHQRQDVPDYWARSLFVT